MVSFLFTKEINEFLLNFSLLLLFKAISEIYTQHKVHVCEQLNEVHKLMSISSDDDLFLHLQ